MGLLHFIAMLKKDSDESLCDIDKKKNDEK